MKMDLSHFKKNIISWYPIKYNQSILEIGNDKQIVSELEKVANVVSITPEIIGSYNTEKKFDFVVLIGTLEKLRNEKDIIKVLEGSKKFLKEDGKILLAMQNKFGMKYWAGENVNENLKAYSSIISAEGNILGINQIENILTSLKFKYKFYYPLPDYKLTNVIFTDNFMPDNESIDARDLTFCDSESTLNFSERDAYKQILSSNKEQFRFFANSFFIEISLKENFENINFVSFGITRKEQYQIKTIIKDDFVYKYPNNKKAIAHIEHVSDNINSLKECNIEVLGEYKEDCIKSEFLNQAKSLDKVMMEVYYKNGLEELIQKIEEFKKDILEKLVSEKIEGKNVFNKYEIKIPVKLKEKLHFAKKGILDLIFQNCLVKENKIYAYDQEWSEENVPIEFILYRAIIYFTELRNKENIEKIFELLGLSEYIEYFEILENKIQEKIVDQDVWNLHLECVREIGNTREILYNYKNKLSDANEHIEDLEKNVEEYKQGIQDLTKLIENKDIELVNYANQIRGISNSLSWRLTKPLRIIAWMLNPKSGATLVDRILPPGGKRRIEFDRKQTEKKYNKKVKNYFKLTDLKTAEYWKGIDHREYLKYEKDLEKEKENQYTDYEKWILSNTPNNLELEKQEKTIFRKRPRISIVIPLYNTNIEFFRELLYTIHCQTYSNWELCLADGSEKELTEIKEMCSKDKRIKYKFLGENKGISGNTNAAIEMATGSYISLVDHDDMLNKSALYEVVKVINTIKDVDFIYTDEDKFHFIDESRFEPHFKPDYAPDTLRANNYICHYSVFKRSLLKKIGGFKSEFDGAQDYDIILRATEQAKKIVHIPKVLYHWRIHKNSTAMTSEAKPYAIQAGKRAIEEHLTRIGLKGKVTEGVNSGTYQIDYEIIGNPKVTIVIPNRDEMNTLKMCIDSIVEKTTYKNYEVVIVENNSKTKEIFNYYEEIVQNPKIKVLNYNKNSILTIDGEKKFDNRDSYRIGFNYSRIINYGVKNTDGEFIVQLNNDTEVITENWIEKMVGFCQRDDVGVVGAKLYYPDETIQHAGIIVGARTVAAHVLRGIAKEDQGYFGRENLIQNMNAVTAACIMTKRSIYDKIGYMNESFAVAFNDVDFCLRIRDMGKLVVYNPFVELWHYESKSRGDDNAPDKIERFQEEINLFLKTWKDKLDKGDEYYNKNFRLDSDQYEIRTDKID